MPEPPPGRPPDPSSAGPFRIGEFTFDPIEGTLRGSTASHRLSPREAATLLALVARAGRLVDKDTLMREVWNDAAVEENNLNQQISHLRRLLGQAAAGEAVIETVPRRGYRLALPVERLGVGPAMVLAPDVIAPTSWWSSPRRAALTAAVALVIALAAWAVWLARSRVAEVHTLAVLPFQNLTGDAANDYLSEGLTDEVITELARAAPGRLRVIGRTSAARYRGSTDPLNAIARSFGADLVLEGSVRGHANRLRVTARLSDTRSHEQIWAHSYDQELGDVLDLERTLAEELASTIRVNVVPVREAISVAPRALDAYRRARYYHALATVPSIERAIESYTEALSLEPRYAQAYAGLARAYVFSTRTPPRVALERARGAAQQAVRLDRTLPETQLAWAMIRLYADRDFEGAEQEFRRAIDMDRGSAEPYFYYAQMLTAAGRFDEALASAQHALAIDPFSPLVHHYVGRIHCFAHRPADAIVQLQGTIELDPNYAWARLFLTTAYEQSGQFDRALEERQRYWSLMGVPADRVVELRGAYARDGYAGARRMWIEWISGFERQRGFVTSTEGALLYASLSERDRAFEALDRAVESGVRDLIYLKVYPELEPLHADPRFEQLVRRVFRRPDPS